MPRLLTIIESIDKGGGAEQALVHLLPSLKERGFEVEVCALWNQEGLRKDLEERGVAVHQLGLNYQQRWKAPPHLQFLADKVRAFKPDIIHSHLYFASLYSGLLPKLAFPAKKVVSFHSMDYEVHPPKTPLMKGRAQGHGFIIRNNYDGWVGVSQAVVDHYQHHYHLREMEVIPNVVPVENIKPKEGLDTQSIRDNYQAQKKDFLITVPGRLVMQKGHKYLLEGLKILKDAQKTLPKVLIVGSGPLKKEIEELIENYQLRDSVQMVAVMPHHQLMELLQASDAVVMASIIEGFGIAAAEAMAMEKPLIATQIGALKEMVADGETGYLVPPADGKSIAEALERLMASPETAQRMAKAARPRVTERFSAEKVASDWEDYYYRLLWNAPA